MRPVLVALALACAAPPATAEIAVRWSEGRLAVENRSGCDAGPFEFILDLRLAAPRLRFGVPPFATESGAEWIAATTTPGSGAMVLTVALRDLPAGAGLSLALAVEDAKGRPAAALAGAVAAVAFGYERTDAALDASGAAILRGFGCLG